ncbi:unnamed protein product [Bursaphelenchus okinawaensis]|uniref:Acyltransferase 3 domain-containing protein n=1 Tax=Bursaphelenchus okinawaensis TaxID=465554 RepID=A0A811KCZ3_9BILA|nr:unnamed protein product [Bursaphelenchus okinawaensis]CAG9101305.1 unnamed protein product [Bursaphelenchus okinawaensis]
MLLHIQGIRCIAIAFVVLYHLRPDLIKNGYLGVDVFFVISGFLMHMLMKDRDLTVSTISNFYFRRLRRILPLYVTILLSTAIIAYFAFNIFVFNNVLTELKTAATLTSKKALLK